MSDARSTQPPHTDEDQRAGHGKHRGKLSTQDVETAPRGRHRKPAPSERTESAAA